MNVKILEKDIRALKNMGNKETLQIKLNYEIIRLHDTFILFKIKNNIYKFIEAYQTDNINNLLTYIEINQNV